MGTSPLGRKNSDDVASQFCLWLVVIYARKFVRDGARITDELRHQSAWKEAPINSKYTKQRDIFLRFVFFFAVALEASEVSLNLVPLKCLIQGSASQVLKKTDMAVKVGVM